MIQEIVIQQVQAEKRDEYVQVFAEILKKANFAGSHGIKFFTSVEDPSRVILMIEWDSVEAHTQIAARRCTTPCARRRESIRTVKSDGGHFLTHVVK